MISREVWGDPNPTRSSFGSRGWGTRACVCVEGAECGVEGECEEKREQRVWNEDACEEEDAGGGQGEERGVKACALRECAASPGVAEEREAEDGERERKMNREGVLTEDAEAGGGDPVGEWRLFRDSGCR